MAYPNLQTPEDEERARNFGLLGAGLGILANNRGNYGAFGPALGAGGLLGMQMYGNELQGAQQNRLRGLQAQQAQGGIEMQNLQLQEAKRAATEREQYRRLLQESGSGPGGKSLTPPGSMPVQQPAVYQEGRFVSQPDKMDVKDNMRAAFAQNLISRGQQLTSLGMQNGNSQAYDMGLKLVEQGTKYMPEVHKVETVMVGDRPTNRIYFKDGTHKDETDAQPKPNYQLVNTGAQQIPVDLTTGRRSPAGAFPNQMSPAEGDASRRGWLTLNLGQVPKAADVRKELHGTKEYQTWVVARPVLEAARKAVKVDNAAADLDIIYAVAKQVDPDSVVREGETAMVIKTGSPAQRFMGTWNFVTGGGRLTPTQRSELMRVIEDRGQAHYDNFQRAYEPYKHSIEKHRLDPKEIVDEKIFDFGQRHSTTAAPNQPPPMTRAGTIDKSKLVKGQGYFISGQMYDWNGMEFVRKPK